MKTKIIYSIIALGFVFQACTWNKVQNELSDLISKKAKEKGIAITYPYNNCIMPPELAAPTFEWSDSSFFTNSWYIFLISEEGKVVIKDKITQMKWKPDSADWVKVKKTLLGKTCDFYVVGKNNSEYEKGTSWAHISFQISKDSVGAEIFFRAVTLPFSYAVKNVNTIEWYMGKVGSEKPRKMLDNMPVCANCHSFSVKNPTLAMDVDYGNDKGSYTLTPVEDTARMTPNNIISWSNFKKDETEPTFGLLSQISPDSKFVLSTVKDLSVFVAVDNNMAYSQLFFPIKGIIGIYDRENKTFSELNGANDPRLVQSNPVWSPDGKKVVFARTEAYVSERIANAGRALLHPEDVEEFTSGSKQFKYDLYTLDFNEGSGSKPVPLIGASNNGKSNYFPKYSPDGKWIVFCKSDNFMLLQPDSKLYMVPSEGGNARLMNCNLGNMNSWHSWSPNGKWIVFSSKQRGKYTQLYLTHIDEQGNDSPPVLLENLVFDERAANIPEFYPANANDFKHIKDAFSNTAPYFTQIAADQIDNFYYKKAWANLDKAIKLDSTYLDAFIKRITLNSLLHQSGSKNDKNDKIKAQEIVEKLIKSNSNDEQLLLLKATLESSLGNTKEALHSLQNILQKFPNSIKTHELIASIHKRNKEYNKAIDIYHKIQSLKPNNPLGLKTQIIITLNENQQYNQAFTQINDLVRQFPNDEGLRVIRAQIAIELKDIAKAKTDIDWLIGIDNSNYKYYQLIAQYNLLAKETDNYKFNVSKSLDLLSAEISKNPENIELYFQRALTQQSIRQYSEAISDYTNILSIFPTNYEALKQMAKIKLSQKLWAEAISIYKTLIENYSQEEEFYNNSALAHIQLGSYKNASNCFEKAVNINPENIDARYNKARLHKMMNEDRLGDIEINEIIKILDKKKQKGTINSSELELYNSLSQIGGKTK